MYEWWVSNETGNKYCYDCVSFEPDLVYVTATTIITNSGLYLDATPTTTREIPQDLLAILDPDVNEWYPEFVECIVDAPSDFGSICGWRILTPLSSLHRSTGSAGWIVNCDTVSQNFMNVCSVGIDADLNVTIDRSHNSYKDLILEMEDYARDYKCLCHRTVHQEIRNSRAGTNEYRQAIANECREYSGYYRIINDL